MRHAATRMQVLTDMYMHRDSLCRMARPTWKQVTGWQRWGTYITCTGTSLRSKAWSNCCASHSIPYYAPLLLSALPCASEHDNANALQEASFALKTNDPAGFNIVDVFAWWVISTRVESRSVLQAA